MPKKLFLATVEVEVYLLADSEEEAEREACDYIQEEVRYNGDALAPHVREISEKPRYMSWTRDSFVYGDPARSRTLGELVDQLPEEGRV